MDTMSQIVPISFLAIIGAIAVSAIINPSICHRWMLAQMKLYCNFFGYEVEIKPTPRADLMCRLWNTVCLGLVILFFHLFWTGKVQ